MKLIKSLLYFFVLWAVKVVQKLGLMLEKWACCAQFFCVVSVDKVLTEPIWNVSMQEEILTMDWQEKKYLPSWQVDTDYQGLQPCAQTCMCNELSPVLLKCLTYSASCNVIPKNFSGSVHTTLEEFETAALFLRLGLPSTLIRHENEALFLRLGESLRWLETVSSTFQDLEFDGSF